MEKEFRKTKKHNNISDSLTNYISISCPKYSMIKETSSNIINISNSNLLIQDNKNNNSKLKLDLNNEDVNSNTNINIKKKLLKCSIPKTRNKDTIKIRLFKKGKKRKYKTIFERIITNLDKVKIKTDKTLDIMKKNLILTKNEIDKRKEYQKQSQIIFTNKLNLGNNKEKKSNLSCSLDYTKKNFYHKSMNHITQIISSSTKNKNVRNNSTKMRLINENHELSNVKMNNSLFNGFKTCIHSYSQNNINKKHLIYNEKIDDNFKEKLNLFEIPKISLNSIKNKIKKEPLFAIKENKKCYKNMYHDRNLDFPLDEIRTQFYKLYNIPAIFIEQNSYSKDPETNYSAIINKIQLIQDNIDYFKINIMYKNDFLEAFINMENYQKAEFNYYIEAICCIIIKIIPIIFKNYFMILKKLLYIVIPDIDKEIQKQPKNEDQCLNINYSFFNSTSDYLKISFEVYKVLNKKYDRFEYSIKEFAPLNSYLDIARYNTNHLITTANSFINKTKNDLKILNNLEIGLNMKKKIIKRKEILDFFERNHLRNKKIILDENIKIERINNALNLKSRINRPEINEVKYSDKYKFNKKISVINSPVFRDLLKYINPSIKATIIAQQIIDRLEEKNNQYQFLNESVEK